MFRQCGLWPPDRFDRFRDCHFPCDENLNEAPALRFCNCVKNVRGGACSGHSQTTYAVIGICKGVSKTRASNWVAHHLLDER